MRVRTLENHSHQTSVGALVDAYDIDVRNVPDAGRRFRFIGNGNGRRSNVTQDIICSGRSQTYAGVMTMPQNSDQRRESDMITQDEIYIFDDGCHAESGEGEVSENTDLFMSNVDLQTRYEFLLYPSYTADRHSIPLELHKWKRYHENSGSDNKRWFLRVVSRSHNTRFASPFCLNVEQFADLLHVWVFENVLECRLHNAEEYYELTVYDRFVPNRVGGDDEDDDEFPPTPVVAGDLDLVLQRLRLNNMIDAINDRFAKDVCRYIVSPLAHVYGRLSDPVQYYTTAYPHVSERRTVLAMCPNVLAYTRYIHILREMGVTTMTAAE